MSKDLLGFPGMTNEEAEKVIAERKRRREWKKIPKKMRKAARFDAAGLGCTTDIGIPVPKDGLKIAVVTDAQCKPGVPLDHLKWCGEYLARKQPDVIVCIGDFYDFESLSTHDSSAQKGFEQRTYVKDLDAGNRGMELLMTPIEKAPRYKPYKKFTKGNHEDRTERVVNDNPTLRGLIKPEDMRLEDFGWDVYPFLEPINIAGIAFAHFFPSGVMGRPITSASELLRKLHMSAFAGHQQGREIAYSRRADGSNMTAIISGSFYQHSEDYLSPFTNKHWRGMYMLHECQDGSFDEMAVSIRFLEKKFKKRRKR